MGRGEGGCAAEEVGEADVPRSEPRPSVPSEGSLRQGPPPQQRAAASPACGKRARLHACPRSLLSAAGGSHRRRCPQQLVLRKLRQTGGSNPPPAFGLRRTNQPSAHRASTSPSIAVGVAPGCLPCPDGSH